MNYEKKLVSPTQAKQWLRGSKQPKVRLPCMKKLWFAMERGEWDIDNTPNDPIRIKDGAVEDGHHRLVAIIMYGKPVELKVMVQ